MAKITKNVNINVFIYMLIIFLCIKPKKNFRQVIDLPNISLANSNDLLEFFTVESRNDLLILLWVTRTNINHPKDFNLLAANTRQT